MNNAKTIIAALILISFGTFFTSCGNNQDPATYNNKLMVLMNNNEKDMTDMNAAMSAGDYKKAESVRQSWLSHLDNAIKEAKDAGNFKGSDDLKNGIVGGLENYRKIVAEDYQQLINIRSKGDSTQQSKESDLLNNINKAFEEAGNTVNKAEADFETKFVK